MHHPPSRPSISQEWALRSIPYGLITREMKAILFLFGYSDGLKGTESDYTIKRVI